MKFQRYEILVDFRKEVRGIGDKTRLLTSSFAPELYEDAQKVAFVNGQYSS